MKVRFSKDFNYIPPEDLRISINYRAQAPDAEPVTVPHAHAKAAIAAGAAVEVRAPKVKAKVKPEPEDDGAQTAAG